MDKDLFIEHIQRYGVLSQKEIALFRSYFIPKVIPKHEFLLTQGSLFDYEGFVVNGCFRTFLNDAKGNENTLYFATNDWWLMDIDSFMNAVPSQLNIQALEDSSILIISKSDKLRLYQTIPATEKLFRLMFQKAIVAWQRRLIRNHCLTAKERYKDFIETYPNIASKVTDRQIASYLGITHEFLCKIKKQLLFEKMEQC